MNKKIKLFFLGALVLALALGMAAIALASNGNPSATIPSSGDTTTGLAASMFGSVSQGLTIYNANCAACHGSAGKPTLDYPGLASVQNPNTSYSIDSELYDPNPALFARNIDCFIQHGSNPGGTPMPSFGDDGMLTQTQIANVEAYVMSLSNVSWPTLTLSGTSLLGSNFVPQTLVQLYQNGSAIGPTINTGVSGAFTNAFSPPAGQSGTITANYAVLDEPGIYPNGDSEQGDLALDSTRGAAFTVASLSYIGPGVGAGAPTTSAAAATTAPTTSTPQTATVLPKTGSNVTVLLLAGGSLTLLGATLVYSNRKRRVR